MNTNQKKIPTFKVEDNHFASFEAKSFEGRESFILESKKVSVSLSLFEENPSLLRSFASFEGEGSSSKGSSLRRSEAKSVSTPKYYEKIDMLNSVLPLFEDLSSASFEGKDFASKEGRERDDSSFEAKEVMQTHIQKYLRSFTTMDISLAQDQHSIYEFKPETFNSKILNQEVYKILEFSFYEMSSVISRPFYDITPNNVVINLFYFVIDKNIAKKNFLEGNISKLQGLTAKLSKYFRKPVNLELVQLHSISNNSQILAHIFGKLGLFRKSSFSKIIGRFLKHQSTKIFFKSNLRSTSKISRFSPLLTGVNIKLGGRLMRGKIIPRRTVKKIQYGSLSRSKSNYITTGRLTQKNKRGSFTFSVSIGHRFF